MVCIKIPDKIKKHSISMLSVIVYVFKQMIIFKPSYIFMVIPFVVLEILKPFPAIIFPQYIVDGIIINDDIAESLGFVLMLVSSMLVLNILSSFIKNKMKLTQSGLTQELTLILSKMAMKMNYTYLEDNSIKEKINRAKAAVNGDTNFSTRAMGGDRGVEAIFSETINIVISIVKICSVIYILSALNWGIILLIVVVVVINAIMASIKKRAEYERRQKTTRIGDQSAYLRSVMTDSANGKEIRLNTMQDYLIDQNTIHRLEFVKQRYQNYTTNIKADLARSVSSGVQELVIYVYLIYQVLNANLTLGEFTMYAAAVSAFSSFLLGLIDSFQGLSLFTMFFVDYMDVLKLSSTETDLNYAKKIDEDTKYQPIIFKNVWFKYPQTDDYALKDINITINFGEKLSVIGGNGAGKTTFIKLITRLYKPDKGEIFLGSTNINDFGDDYTDYVTAIFQDYKIYSISASENIAFNDVDDIKIRSVLDKLSLWSVIGKLPQKSDTIMSKEHNRDGIELSQGQQQKLAFARAIYKDSVIMILDEPTASLDPVAEQQLYDDFSELTKNKTTIYISHRLSSSRFCDKVAVFDKSRIVEYGTHDELMSKSGLYYEMFSKQAEYYRNF